ncbi:MAG: hypothetical protein PHH24_01975 [Candidatus Moranbacteria bacterium]|jgi:hypothetical protein|nr:hypothetical protein [Candidatus Moranbacteria bacterium]MDD5652372.1 hypothetical protein [Candidatus Moranbacteria bacterium]MDX9855393.1 hypothetical protein [Candidatus Moranbacteria bacterium]
MVDVNLHQAAEKELRIKRSVPFFKTSPFISFSLLAIVLILYGGTILYQKVLESKSAELAQAKEQELKTINADAANEAIDFQNRLDSSLKNLEKKVSPKDTLDALESMMVKGVFLNSLVNNTDSNKMEIEAVSDGFKTTASQMLSFKKSDIFTDVRINESGRDENGRVVFSMEADLKK